MKDNRKFIFNVHNNVWTMDGTHMYSKKVYGTTTGGFDDTVLQFIESLGYVRNNGWIKVSCCDGYIPDDNDDKEILNVVKRAIEDYRKNKIGSQEVSNIPSQSFVDYLINNLKGKIGGKYNKEVDYPIMMKLFVMDYTGKHTLSEEQCRAIYEKMKWKLSSKETYKKCFIDRVRNHVIRFSITDGDKYNILRYLDGSGYSCEIYGKSYEWR